MALASTVLVCGCVSQQKYQDTLELSKYYQDSYLDVKNYADVLEAKVERMQAGPRAATASKEMLEDMPTDPVIDQRMRQLEQLTSGFGRGSGDVAPVRVEGGYGFSVSDSVLFDSGSAELASDGRQILLDLASDISSRPFETVWVRGHTDSDPVSRPETLDRFPNGNLGLSVERALEVAAVLTREGGIPAARVVAAGFGPARPVGDNSTTEGKRANRRVEIFVLEDDPERDPSGEPGGEGPGAGGDSGQVSGERTLEASAEDGRTGTGNGAREDSDRSAPPEGSPRDGR